MTHTASSSSDPASALPPSPRTEKCGYDGLSAGSKPEEWWGKREEFEDGRSLRIDGHPVMEAWENPYMKELSRVATTNGGRVLEVGFGLGLSARAVQSHATTQQTTGSNTCHSSRPPVVEHVIVEANQDVYQRLCKFASEEAACAITPVLGLWQEVVFFVKYGLSRD
eukprot:GHVQ01025058.1.p1 GENE.GHVQ01025058.1~~GHVQ01025058.1.p1  ORF type:complete len:167 (-),score=27.07 GHVQ01025058.1:960-1460(-)